MLSECFTKENSLFIFNIHIFMSKPGAHDLVTMEMKCPLSGNLDPHGLDHIPQG